LHLKHFEQNHISGPFDEKENGGNAFMADIRLKRTHPYSRDEAKRRIEPSIDKTAESFGLTFQWNGDVCYFEGQASGYIAVKNYAVEMAVNLGFAARLLKSTIERTIIEEIDQVLA
jgi:putative polyhydroxyalkanoate system protein